MFAFTWDEMLEKLVQECEGNIEKVHVVIIPSDVDELTDEDEACDNLM